MSLFHRLICGAAFLLAAACTPKPAPTPVADTNAKAGASAIANNPANIQATLALSQAPVSSLPVDLPITHEQSLDRFVGDWIVIKASPNPMDEQINVWIRREGSHLAIFESGVRELDLLNVSVEVATGEISMVETLPDVKVTLTRRPLTASQMLDSLKPDIEMVWGDGTRWLLAGGQLPSQSDDYSNETIATMREGGHRVAYRVESGFKCYGENLNFRYRTLCKDQALSRNHLDLMSKFTSISGEYPDSHRTYQAAIRSLNACTISKCLKQQYAQWDRYLDDNYPMLQAVD